jgi:uncharacterized RDD family membrane protein YckC
LAPREGSGRGICDTGLCHRNARSTACRPHHSDSRAWYSTISALGAINAPEQVAMASAGASTSSETTTGGSAFAAAPQSALPPVPTIWRRVAALPYEGLLLLALVLIASFPIAGLKGLALTGVPHVVYQAYLFAVTAWYFCWQWQKSGQTLPMKTWRFRVASKTGNSIGWGRALVRFLWALAFFGPACVGIVLFFFPQRLTPAVTVWFFLPMLATLLYARFDRERQFLHDRLAGTRLQDATIVT